MITISDLKSYLHWEPATAADRELIYRQFRAVASYEPAHTGWDEYYPGYEQIDSDLQEGTVLVAWSPEHRLVATMSVLPAAGHAEDACFTPLKKPAFLSRFSVSPDFQGQGVGRVMMQKTLDWCRERGYDGVRFYAEQENPLSCHLYYSMGFRDYQPEARPEHWTALPFEMVF